MKIQVTCKVCSKVFSVFPIRVRQGVKFCSIKCRFTNYKGFWFGKKRSLEDIEKISKSNRGKHHSIRTEFKKGDNVGKKNYEWKGINVSYRSLHKWVMRWLGCPTKCENCGKKEINNRLIHWANRSGRYLRNLNDWIRLCSKCHGKYDKQRRQLKPASY